MKVYEMHPELFSQFDSEFEKVDRFSVCSVTIRII
jgi:hypothetical protein